MSLFITTTPDAVLGRVTVRIVYSGVVRAIKRADVNGTSAVRLPAGTLPAPMPPTGSGVLEIIDYEAALSGAIQYRINTDDGNGDQWTQLGAVGELAPRFNLPSVPVYDVAVQMVTNYTANRTGATTTHDVPGRPDPLVVLGKMKSRRGRLEITSDTATEGYADAATLEGLLERGQVVFFRQSENPGQDMYFVPLGLDTSSAGNSEWTQSVDYVQVAIPAGDLLGDPTWTFAQLAATGGSFEDVARDYDNFVQLAIGEEAL